MNVLMMGIPFFASEEPVRLYSSTKGHEVRFLVARGHGGPFPAQSRDFTFDPQETVTDVVQRISENWPVDALVCWCPELFPPPREVERAPVKTVAIVSDWNIYFPQLEYNMARYDLVVTDRPGSLQLKLPGSTPHYFGPLYSHRSPIHRKMEIEKDIDILFAGNLNHAAHIQRGRCLEKVASLSDRFRVVLCSGLDAAEYASMLNRARIAFNHSIRGEMNLRCFEALACGSLLFVEGANTEVQDWLRDRENVVLYNPENLTALLEHYLADSCESDRIVRSGLERAQRLAGERRLDDLIDWIALQPFEARAFPDFDEATRAFADIMQYASSLIDEQRQLTVELLNDACGLFPDRPEFRAASGCVLLDSLDAVPKEEHKGATKAALRLFGEACSLAPDVAPLWMNLAYFSRCTGTTGAEIGCLEKVMQSRSCDCDGLVAGSVFDPFYSKWRRSLATGQARTEILWAAAATRLAEIRIEQDLFEEAAELAHRATQWQPDIGLPHRLMAQAESRLGNHEKAAAILEQSLPLTAFDAPHRRALIEEWVALGKVDSAQALATESHRLFACCQGGETQADMFMRLAAGAY